MAGTGDPPDTRPLYARVRDALIARIMSGGWKPGQLIPNEFAVAAEFSVSQGTARKAIDSLAADGLVVRRQGKGTFVVEHTPANVLFRFFHVYDAAGVQIRPDSPPARPRVATASTEESRVLAIARNARVIRIERVRTRDGRAFITETIVLPEAVFPGLGAMREIPNTLYDLFQLAHGVLVARADERITAVLAGAREAKLLAIPQGMPLLRIDRVAFDLANKPVEWRVSLCHLDGAHYEAHLK